MVLIKFFFYTRLFSKVLLLCNGIYDISNDIIIAGCDPNEHINGILQYGSSETVPGWTVTCGYRG